MVSLAQIPGIEHVPRSIYVWLCAIAIGLFFATLIVTTRNDNRHYQLRSYSLPRKRIAEILGNISACAPDGAAVPWATTKDHRLLIAGKEKKSPRPLSTKEFEDRVSTMINEIMGQQRGSKGMSLRGIQIDLFGLTDLFNQGFITEELLKGSSSTHSGLVIRNLCIAGRKIDLHAVNDADQSLPQVQLQITGHPDGRALVSTVHDLMPTFAGLTPA